MPVEKSTVGPQIENAPPSGPPATTQDTESTFARDLGEIEPVLSGEKTKDLGEISGPPPQVSAPTHEDQTRRWVTYWLLGIFSATILAALVIAALPGEDPHTLALKDILQMLLPAETGLLGSAIGFYFASRKS